LIAVCVLTGALWYRNSRQKAAASRPALAMIPPGPAFLLTLEVGKLRREGNVAKLLAQRLPEISRLAERCGFEPLAELETLALAVPGADARLAQLSSDEFGAVATGRWAKARVLRCAELTIVDRKGEPALTRIGSFSTIRDRRGGGELAVRDGGPLILSGGGYFRALLDYAESSKPGAEPAASRDRVHAELRRALGPDSPLLATWLLPERWTERFVGERDASLSPLAEIRALGLRAAFDRTPSVDAILGCTSEPACGNVLTFLEGLRQTLRPELDGDPLLGLALRVRIEQKNAQIRLRLPLESGELETLLDLVSKARPPPP
jgi:hypothetical protein